MPIKRAKNKNAAGSDATTLRQVAAVARVSEMTVSRVLRKTGSVSEKTRKKVLSVVDELGFVPNRVAGALATSTTNLMAVIVPSLKNQVFTEVLAGVASYLDSTGYKAVIGISDYDLEKEEQLVRSMLSWRPSGLIVSNLAHTPRTRRIMANASVPVVEMMELSDTPIDICVGVDHGKAGALMAHHFLDQGYRRLGYIGWNNQDRTAIKRYNGFLGALAERGVACEGMLEIDRPLDMGIGKNGLKDLLEKYPKLDAVYFPNDVSAIGGVFHCLEAGITIPTSLAIGGFSGIRIGEHLHLPLTTVRIGRFEIGELSAKTIVDRLQGGAPPRINVIDCELVRGATT